FAIEMVYVPEGAFYVGDGNTADILGVFHTIDTEDPFLVDSEAEITLGGTTPGNLGNNHDGTGQEAGYEDDYNIGDPSNEQLLPASFPKGYSSFYIMKYNITQEQYVDFLNTLSRAQQQRRTGTNLASHLTSVTSRYVLSITDTPSSRNGIRVDYTFPADEPLLFYNDLNDDGTPNQFDDGQHLPCNFLAFADGAAYSDWAGLRPMTELEYEKASRGSQTPILNEMAWGEAYDLGVTVIVIEGITNAGENNELPTNATANCHINNNDANINGPVRSGLFSTSTSDRSKSGATYYGIMHMGGNITEQIITTGNPEGRSFDGQHGNGALSTEGVNDVTNWPGSGSTILGDVVGAGIRSNSFASTGVGSRISVRRFVNQSVEGRVRSVGYRAVRSNP
ncbi:MAG: SUMF1/EgtB/PvdO family nonheme iron enzyme, partial [bacterium]